MKVTYIKELEKDEDLLGKIAYKFPKYIKKILVYAKKILGICKIVKVDDTRKIKVLPYTIKELMQKREWYKKQFKKEKNIILSKKLFLNNDLRIQNPEYKIWDAKWLFSFLVMDTLQYICSKIKVNIQQMNIAIVVSDTEEQNVKVIKELAEKVKNISIVTSKIINFTKLEQKLYQEKGIAVKVTNNKRKSLKKEKVIINMDLKQEELEQYEINRNAILINIKENIYGLPKDFLGININNIEINSLIKNEFQSFFYSHIYESKIYKEFKKNNIKERLKEDEIIIEYLIGQRGKIEEKELEKFKVFI